MTLRGHQPAAPEIHAELADRLRAFELALWELIIQLPDDEQGRQEMLQAGCDLANLFRARLGRKEEDPPRS